MIMKKKKRKLYVHAQPSPLLQDILMDFLSNFDLFFWYFFLLLELFICIQKLLHWYRADLVNNVLIINSSFQNRSLPRL